MAIEAQTPLTTAIETLERLATERRHVPRATYRLQFNADFTFRHAEAIVPYLAELGVSDVYASPYLKARPESTHGYDVTDYGALNPVIGSDDDYDALVATLHRHGLGQVFDFVPNHMGIGRGTNAWWMSVLENGQSSPAAEFFDIDWEPLKRELQGQVLLPFLGDHYGVVLENGELELRYDPGEGTFTVHYYETPLPIAPPTYPMILRHPLDELTERLGEEHPSLLEYLSIITALERLPGQDERDPERIAERQREQIVAKRRLADLTAASPEVRAAVEEAVRVFNGTPGDPRSFDLLDQLLEAQSYRLAFWQVAAEEINYRRFFAINELAAIRQEVPEVFAATHALLLQLLVEGKVNGVRIDHPDGLWDPPGYFSQLQRGYLFELLRCRLEADIEPDDWEAVRSEVESFLDRHAGDRPSDVLTCPLYLVVEKILEHGEDLPADWPVHGTTGYEFANAVNGLFVDPANRKAFDELYARYIGNKIKFADLVYDCKKLIMRAALASEVNVLARALDRIAERNRRSRDFTLNDLRFAMREVVACFPVYRTYTVCDGGEVAERDRRYIEQAVAVAKRRNHASNFQVFDFVRDVLLLRYPEDASAEQRAEQCHFVMKFQQLTGPVMAKGLEDTAFYIYNRLASLNEVGGDPTQFGVTVAAFHRQNVDRLKRWPFALLTTSTHDTKRSEDVRARMDVLSETPREWRAAINRWARLNRKWKTKIEGTPAPDRNDEYLLYQTLLGAWPFEDTLDPAAHADVVERMVAYMLKATREAQIHTSWINPNTGYEEATERFVRAILDAAGPNPFLDDFGALRRKVAHFGAFNALGQQLLKLASPGVPDIYQGTEIWDLSLVDPDNRRPVDYGHRTQLLRDLKARRGDPALAADLVEHVTDGRIKLFVTERVLACRRDLPDLFGIGDYVPLEAGGAKREHVCAFARRLGEREIVVVVPRLLVGLTGGAEVAPVGADLWGDTRLTVPGVVEDQAYRDLFTGATVRATAGERGGDLALAEVLGVFPVAMLERVTETGA